MKAAARRVENFVLSINTFTDIRYDRKYSMSSLILMFFTFSSVGWLWEVLLHIIEDGMIINRGMMTGPWLPIYGVGGVLILTVLRRWQDRPFFLVTMIMLVCGAIEYVTSIVTEHLFGAIWWDYSDMLLNIQGRVCLEGLMIFGIGGLAIVYIIAPKLDNLFVKLSDKARILLSVLLVGIFVADMVRSFITPNMGFGITI